MTMHVYTLGLIYWDNFRLAKACLQPILLLFQDAFYYLFHSPALELQGINIPK